MAEIVRLPNDQGKETVYSGTFVNPYIDSINFESQGNLPTCLAVALRVGLQGLGINRVRGIPLDQNRRMIHIFHACGITDIEMNGARAADEIRIIQKIEELKQALNMGTIENDPVEWAKAVLQNKVILLDAISAKFYNNLEFTDRHALTLLGVDIPSPKEDRDLGFLIFNPNDSAPKWWDSSVLIPTLGPQQVALWRKQPVNL